MPTVAPASAPASQPASQPTSVPAVARERIMPILKGLDSDDFKEREAAQKKLQDLGVGALPPLREILKKEGLSMEVVGRIKTAMWNIKATTRPALLTPPPEPEIPRVRLGAMPDRPRPLQPTENPED